VILGCRASQRGTSTPKRAMCRAHDTPSPSQQEEQQQSALPGVETKNGEHLESDTRAPSTDPLDTDLQHFHPSSGSFSALPRGEFTIVKKIAAGIHGDVFRYKWMWQGNEGAHVSVKRLRAEAVARRSDMENNERRAHLKLGNCTSPCHEDALTEIGVLQYLSAQADLPVFILRMHDIFQDRSHVWLVTEFAEGGELFEEVAQQGPLSHSKAKRYAWEMLQAIGYLHRHCIGHRDVSLENVLIKDGSLRLMDFGMAVHSHDATGTALRYFRAVGKDFYRAPECYVPQADFVNVVVPPGAEPSCVISTKVNERYLCEVLLPADAKPNCRARAKVYGYEATPVDVFSAGICLFILLTGNPPWGQATLSESGFSWVLQHDIVELMMAWGLPVVVPELADLLKGMTAADPAKRWSAEACASCLWLREAACDIVPVHSSDVSRSPAVLRTLAGA